MNRFELTNLERLMLERKRRKRIVKITIISLLCLIILAFVLIKINNSIDEKLPLFLKTKGNQSINLKTLTVPEYVDVELIENQKARSGEKIEKINNIVIHYVGNPGTTAKNNRDYFNKSDTDVCSHFVVGLDGEIIQCVPLNEKSSASNYRNFDTISIEVCHSDSTGKFNTDTYNSLVKLVGWLCKNSNLTADDVIRHYDITGKECPKYFVDNESEWKKFIKDVKREID